GTTPAIMTGRSRRWRRRSNWSRRVARLSMPWGSPTIARGSLSAPRRCTAVRGRWVAGELHRPLACGFMPVATPGALPAGGGVVQGPNDSWWRAVPIVRGEVSMNQTPTLRDDLVLASEAALAAGAEVRSRFRDGAEVHYKTPHQPVTEADLRADEILRRHLLKSRPDYGWLSEESADSAQRLHRRRVWVVDPID